MAKSFGGAKVHQFKPDKDGNAFRSSGSHIKFGVGELRPVVVESALRIPDELQAQKELERLHDAAFHAKYGAEVTDAEEGVVRWEPEYEIARAERDTLRLRNAKTPTWIPASRLNHEGDGNTPKEMKFRDWALRHKVETVVCLPAIGVLAAASALTSHANLVGTGLEIFTAPGAVLPWAISTIPPLIAFAMKTIGSSLHSSWARNTFSWGLSTTMIASSAIWLGLYSDIYHGLSPSVSLSGLFDESAWDEIKTTLFTGASLVTEILVGATLAHRLTLIAENYSPDYVRLNPEKPTVLKALEEAEAELDAVWTKLKVHKGILRSLQNSLEQEIALLTLAHKSRRGAMTIPTL